MSIECLNILYGFSSVISIAVRHTIIIIYRYCWSIEMRKNNNHRKFFIQCLSTYIWVGFIILIDRRQQNSQKDFKSLLYRWWMNDGQIIRFTEEKWWKLRTLGVLFKSFYFLQAMLANCIWLTIYFLDDRLSISLT